MTMTTRILVLIAGLATTVAAEAQAQTLPAPASLGFVNINVGAQLQSRDIAKSDTFTVYDEPATLTTSQTIGKGPIFDISGGYRVWHSLSIGVGFSSFSKDSSSSAIATIPDPLVFGQSKTVNADATGLEHSERAIHLQAVWFVPITEKIDVALSVGPSFIRVRHQLVSSVTVPAGTQNVNLVVDTQKGTAKGANVGLDGTYLFRRTFGAGFFIRYAGGSIDLPDASGLKVGGFQVGVGARARF
jgi:hypothetical protein